MQPLERPGFTAEQVMAQLHGPRTTDWRWDLLDVDGRVLGPLTTVTGGSLEHQALDDVPRTHRLQLGREQSQIDYARHRVRPWFRLLLSDGTWAEWPQGVFLLSTPTRAAREAASSRTVEAYDQTVVLAQDLVDTRVRVAAGTNVVTAALGQLQASGLTQVSAEPHPGTLPADLEWEVGTARARIVGDLLESINYARLWFDGMGRAVLRPYRPPAEQSPGYRYADDSSSVTAPELDDTLDLYALPNRWVAVVSEPDRPPLTSTYTNTAASSPTSTVARGRVVARVLTDVKAVDQVTLDAYVLRVAQEASQAYRRVTFQTAGMPHHEHLDLLELQLQGLGATGLFTEVGWTLECAPGALMQHTVRQLVSV